MVEMGFETLFIASESLDHIYLRIFAKTKGIKITVAKDKNISQKLTETSTPAIVFITKGMVIGASSDVKTVNTRAKFCLPPIISTKSGAVIPEGIADKRRKAKANSGASFREIK